MPLLKTVTIYLWGALNVISKIENKTRENELSFAFLKIKKC